MKRLQIMLEDDLYAELARRANAEGRSKAAIVRDSLRQTIPPLPPLEEDPLWGMVGIDDGEPVEDVDAYLVDLIAAKKSTTEQP
jgi:plasmid stability protein